MKRIPILLLSLMMVIVSACQDGASDVALVETPYVDAASGFQVRFPEDWWVQGEPGLIVTSSSTEMLRGEESLNLNTLRAPLIVIRVAPLASLGFATPQNADELIDTLEEAASEDASLDFGRTRNQRFDGVTGRYADFQGSLESSGQPVNGRIYAVVTDRLAATIIGAAPADEWGAFEPVLDAIIGSVGFSTN